jgi:uncharacterized protein YbdZ (MbtH family)
VADLRRYPGGLAYVEQYWTDLRPRSLREAMAADG